MRNLRTIKDLAQLEGKTVLVRCDLDVPLDGENVISDFRLKKAVPTIKFLVDQKAKVVLLGHLGRPEGDYQDNMSLMPVRFELGKKLGMHIKFAHIAQSRNSIRYMENGEVTMLENLRFNPGEESADKAVRAEFVKDLAELGDYYINDAFATYREPSASTIDLATMFDAPIAGMQMQAEVENLTKLNDDPAKPYVAIVGGAKLDSKIPVLQALVKQADSLLLGGAMAYTFLKAQGTSVGDSKVEEAMLPQAKQILLDAKKHGCEIWLPIDHLCGKEFAEGTKLVEVDSQQIPDGLIGLDIGEKTLAAYLEVIKSAKSIMWNGPMGVFEWEKFTRGTEAIGEYVALSAPKDTFKVAGGGDTVDAFERLKINQKNYNHISTGGGAMLSFLAGEKIPAIELLYS